MGYSKDLKRRIKQHNSILNKGYTKNKRWKIIYYEAYLDKKDALGRERFLKSGSGRKFIKKQIKHYLTI